MFGFTTVHYVLLLAALAFGIMILMWRWKRLQKQNKALEEELRILTPFNTSPTQALPDEIPRASPLPIPVVKKEPSPEPAPSKTPVVADSPVGDSEDDEDEEDPSGAPPLVENYEESDAEHNLVEIVRVLSQEDKTAAARKQAISIEDDDEDVVGNENDDEAQDEGGSEETEEVPKIVEIDESASVENEPVQPEAKRKTRSRRTAKK